MTYPPGGSCDCHVHVIGDPAAYPMALDRAYTPGPASATQLRQHLQSHGLTRAVIVQPSIYGTDNRVMLSALAELGELARGVAVVVPDIGLPEMKRLHAQGVRGIRLNLDAADSSAIKLAFDQLDEMAPRLRQIGWHVQIYAPARVLAASTSRLAALPMTCVLDHFCMLVAGQPESEQAWPILQDLYSCAHIAVKLSASYRVAQTDQLDYLRHLVQELVRIDPDRLVWGSDWPHTNREPGKASTQVSAFRVIDNTAQLNNLQHWVGDATVLKKILVDNPQRLYDFPNP